MFRQLNTATYPIRFYLTTTDGYTPATGKTVTLQILKEGAGSFAAAAGAVTEISNGWYSWAGNATDRNTTGELVARATATGCPETPIKLTVVPWNPFDANLGLTNLDASVGSRLSTAGYTAPDNAKIVTIESLVSGRLDVAVSSRLATAGYTAPDNSGIATALSSLSSLTSAISVGLDVPVSSRLATAGYTAPPSSATIATSILSTALTESYVPLGAAGTLTQLIYSTFQRLSMFSITDTTIQVKKRDGTNAFALTLNATPPNATSSTQST
jgi:hypothetical protein